MTIEQRLEQLEKRNKRLMVALTMMAVTICALVTMAATGKKGRQLRYGGGAEGLRGE